MTFRTRFDDLVLRWFPRTRAAPLVPAVYWARRSTPRNRVLRLVLSGIRRNYDLVTLERIVEVPFVFRHLPAVPGARVLDFGCSESAVALNLASLGYSVVGVDLRPYPFRHPNLRFVQRDFLACGFPADNFDAVVAISAIEHCGLGAYADPIDASGDRRVVSEIFRVLVPRGRLLVTVPYGRPGTAPGYRVYDRQRLHALLESFTIETAEYYVGMRREHWVPASEASLAATDSVTPGFVQGVACVVAIKP